MTTIERPILRYHGGKWILAPWIISHFPEHRVYTEVFGGAASVLMRKRRSYAEVYNDRWDTVVNVFRVLRNPADAKELERRLRLTPFARTEFEACANLSAVEDPIERARLTIFRSFAGFSSAATNDDYSTGFRCNSNRSGTTPAHDWVNYPDNLTAFVERLQGVVIENREAADVLKQQDNAEALHFVDPPYVTSTRSKAGVGAYAYEMTDDEHRELAAVLSGLKGMVVLCGYDSDLYRELYAKWRMVRREAHGNGAVDRIECLWLNPACAARQAQMTLPL